MADSNSRVKKRNRVALSCTECRTRKLKCDRKQPCNNCISRELTCTFASGSVKSSAGQKPQNEDLRSKLQRLENLVSLMAENSQTNGDHITQQRTPKSDGDSSASPTPEYESRPGHLITNLTGQHYVGPSNWETVLHDIADIREHLDDLPGVPQENPTFSQHRNPALLSGVSTGVTFDELVQLLPPRPLADRLIERFFSVYDPAVPSRQMLHKPTFLQGYENFWLTHKNGFCPSVLGSYYAIFCLALNSYRSLDDEPLDLQGQTQELAETYRLRAAQCSLKSDVTAPTRQALECLLLSAVCEYSRLNEGVTGIFLLMGIITRKALIMGLHRDPDEFSSLSPFEKELRRRLWAHIRQMDLLFGFHLGVPNTLHLLKSNVQPPCNVYEEELTENMKALPPSRPSDEHTPINFTITKLRLVDSLEAILEHVHTVQGYTFEQVEELDQTLQKAMEEIPHHYQVQPVDESLTAPKSLRLQRLQVHLFCEKAVCVLNRRFISSAGMKGPFSTKPRARCINAALNLLHIQERLELEQVRWWLYYLMKHDFLLATTILYLVLFTKCKEKGHGAKPIRGNLYDELDNEDRTIVDALQATRARWARIPDQTPDIQKACRVQESMARQLNAKKPEIQMDQTFASPSLTMPTDSSFLDLNLDETNPTIGGVDFNQLAPMDGQLPQFDWDAWDSSIMQLSGNNYENGWLT